MTTAVPRSFISSGLRRLADLVDQGLLDEVAYPTVNQSVNVYLSSPAAVARFADTLGVDTRSDLDGKHVHVRAVRDLDGVTVSGFSLEDKP